MEVEEYLSRNEHLHTPYNTFDLLRLQGRNLTDTLITPGEIGSTIKGVKNNTTGEPKISKTILKHLPENTLKTPQDTERHPVDGLRPRKVQNGRPQVTT